MQTEVVLGKTPNKFLMCSMGFNLKKKIKILIYIIVSCFPIKFFFLLGASYSIFLPVSKGKCYIFCLYLNFLRDCFIGLPGCLVTSFLEASCEVKS